MNDGEFYIYILYFKYRDLYIYIDSQTAEMHITNSMKWDSVTLTDSCSEACAAVVLSTRTLCVVEFVIPFEMQKYALYMIWLTASNYGLSFLNELLLKHIPGKCSSPKLLFSLILHRVWNEGKTTRTKMGSHNLSENQPTSHKCWADGLAVVCH